MNNAQIQAPLGTISQPVNITKVKYCLYARKSTESEERQILSIDSQIKEMLQLAERENLEVVCMKRESHSAKETGQRPIFNEIIEEIKSGKFNGILTWAPDRISRNAGDLGRVVDLIDAGILKEIRTHSQIFTNNPNEKFLLMILGSQAKLENDNRSINVKRGLRARVEMGFWPGMAPVGYLNQKRIDKKCEIIIDPDRAPIIKQIFEKMAYEKWSGIKIYNWLKFQLNFKTVGNHNVTLGGIFRIIENPLYYGMFEYPKKSGNWYKGKYEPIITEELYRKALGQLKRDKIVRENKEFAFTKLFTCGLCGSSISAQEKYKELKNGTSAKYVYYSCSKAKDRNCRNKYIREEELIEELFKIIDKVDINELGMRMKLEEEIKRFNRLQQLATKGKPKMKIDENEIATREYAKYVLKEGTPLEKRELMGNLRSRLLLNDKKVTLLNK